MKIPMNINMNIKINKIRVTQNKNTNTIKHKDDNKIIIQIKYT